VRDAHLSHFCPGGLGVPVTSSGAVGLPDAAEDAGREDNRLPACGEACGRCGSPLVTGQDVRRRLSGDVVHATCPAQG
jgi:hypothetical protein